MVAVMEASILVEIIMVEDLIQMEIIIRDGRNREETKDLGIRKIIKDLETDFCLLGSFNLFSHFFIQLGDYFTINS